MNNSETIDLGEFIIETEKDQVLLKKYLTAVMNGKVIYKPADLKQKIKKKTTENIKDSVSINNALSKMPDMKSNIKFI